MKRNIILTTLATFLIAIGAYSNNDFIRESTKAIPNPFEFSVLGEKAFLQDIENIEIYDSSNIEIEQTPVIVEFQDDGIIDGLPDNSKLCISNAVKFPEYAKKNQIEGIVILSMMFNESGNLEIHDSFSNNQYLEEYVKTQLHGIRPSNCILWMGKEYLVRFTFRIM